MPADDAGLDEAGRLDADRLRRALARAVRRGARSLEINCHPAEADDPDLSRFSWDYRWADELAMLVDPDTREAVAHAGFTLGGFAALDQAAAQGSAG